jgi:hypothetical protein
MLAQAGDEALLERVARWTQYPTLADLTHARLQRLSEEEGIDFATALLYNRLIHSPQHGVGIARIDSFPPQGSSPLAPAGRGDGGEGARPLTLAIVPGACYVEYPHTGAGGERLRAIAETLGCQTKVVPIESFGSLAENARTICDWLNGCRDERLVVVSLSKGGADLKFALARPEAEFAFRRVKGWVNLSGIVHGTPLAGWFLSRSLSRWLLHLLCWYRGYRFEYLQDLDRRSGGPLDFDLRLPDHLKVLHVVGFPLIRHLSSPLARRTHHRLAPLGPNDGGGIMLADVLRLPGLVYPVWGTDHYMQPGGDMRPLIARILGFVSDETCSGVPSYYSAAWRPTIDTNAQAPVTNDQRTSKY